MVELERSGYYALTERNVSSLVPSCPGIYQLAVRSGEGDHETFFTSQTDNLHKSLRVVIDRGSELHPKVNERLDTYECYFTYFVMPNVEYGDEAAKLLLQTSDPIQRLILADSEEEENFEPVPVFRVI
jgi:hypothetical protein